MEYVSRVLLEVGGTSITDFKSVEEKEHEHTKQVNLMNKSGHLKVTSRYGVEVEYVVPSSTSEFDFTGVTDARLTIDYQNGRRVTYTGVQCGKVGGTKHDGDKESTRTIELNAESRTVEGSGQSAAGRTGAR